MSGLYPDLNPVERLERISQIINKAIYLLVMKEGWFGNLTKGDAIATQSKEVNLEEQQILELCKSKGRITNKDLQNLLGIHRNTATNKLKKMLSRRLLFQYGNGKSRFYAPNFKLG